MVKFLFMYKITMIMYNNQIIYKIKMYNQVFS